MNPTDRTPIMRAHIAASLLILLYAVVAWTLLRPDSIVNDWKGWRQSDTQQIALNTLRDDARFNVPMIAWAGLGATPVEAEFQLYTEITGAILRLSGPAEWPGQLVSLAFMLLASGIVYGWLRTRFDPPTALLGLAAFLSCRAVLALGSTVIPDGLGLAAFVAAVAAFDRWLARPTLLLWLAWVAATALAGLIKPLNLQLGIVQFLWVLFAARAVFARPSLWLGWTLVLAAVAAQLWHGAQIHFASGATFGVISGGDSKAPALVDLFKPGHYRDLALVTLQWGLQPVGFIAAGYLLWKRRLGATEWALTIAYGIAMLVAMRYTSHETFGNQYHASAAVIVALLVALMSRELQADHPERRRVVLLGIAVLLALHAGWNARARLTQSRNTPYQLAYVDTARIMRDRIPNGAVIMARSEAPATVQGWRGGPNNYEDPRFFYLLQATGWPIALDEMSASVLEDHWLHGARWYIEPLHTSSSEEQTLWLQAHGVRVLDTPQARVWALNTP
jgi:hypothetical protein